MRSSRKRILDSAGEVVLFRLREPQFVLVLLPDLRSPLRQFCLEARPRGLVLAVVFVLEQAEGFLGGELGDAGEVLDAEAVKNLCAGEFACARAKRAFDFFGRWRSHRHVLAVQRQKT